MNNPAHKEKRGDAAASVARRARKTPRKITESYLHNAGLYYLQRFSASSGQFRRVMTRKIDKSCRHHTDQDREPCLRMLENVIESFTRSGLLNDEVYTVAAVTSLRRRGLSKQMIERKLQEKALSPSQIQQALLSIDENSGDENPEYAAALRFIRRKKIGCFAKAPADEKTRNRHLAALARAGFSFDIARRVLDLSAGDAENTDSY